MTLYRRLCYLLLALYLLSGFTEARAATAQHQLVLHYYASANRMGLPTRPLGIQPEDVYANYDACVTAGEKRLKDYMPGVLPDGSMLLEYYGCEEVK